MPKKSKHPRLRTHVKRGKAGQAWVSYWYDMRGTGKPDIPLGTDYAQALVKWDAIRSGRANTDGTIEQALTKYEAEVLPNKQAETRRGYTKHLRHIRAVFGGCRWEDIKMRDLASYLGRRTAKTQGNRELAFLSIVWRLARFTWLHLAPSQTSGPMQCQGCLSAAPLGLLHPAAAAV